MINAPRSITKKFQKNIEYLTKPETYVKSFCLEIADRRCPLTLGPRLLSTESDVTINYGILKITYIGIFLFGMKTI